MLDLFSDYYNSSAEDLASFMERLEKEAREIDETSDVILEAEEEQSLQHGERTGQNKQWPEEAVLEKTPEGLPLPSLARNVSATAEDERDILTKWAGAVAGTSVPSAGSSNGTVTMVGITTKNNDTHFALLVSETESAARNLEHLVQEVEQEAAKNHLSPKMMTMNQTTAESDDQLPAATTPDDILLEHQLQGKAGHHHTGLGEIIGLGWEDIGATPEEEKNSSSSRSGSSSIGDFGEEEKDALEDLEDWVPKEPDEGERDQQTREGDLRPTITGHRRQHQGAAGTPGPTSALRGANSGGPLRPDPPAATAGGSEKAEGSGSGVKESAEEQEVQGLFWRVRICLGLSVLALLLSLRSNTKAGSTRTGIGFVCWAKNRMRWVRVPAKGIRGYGLWVLLPGGSKEDEDEDPAPKVPGSVSTTAGTQTAITAEDKLPKAYFRPHSQQDDCQKNDWQKSDGQKSFRSTGC